MSINTLAILTSILVLRKKSSKDYNPKEFLAASFSELTLGTEEFENEKEQFLQEWYSFLQEEEKC